MKRYKYIGESSIYFIRGKSYECLDPENINSLANFIDEYGLYNGYGSSNYKYFIPVEEEESDKNNLIKII